VLIYERRIEMLQRIKVNLEAIESMLFFWSAVNEREKVSEQFLNELAAMPGLALTYDDEFDAESVRRILSAIVNREKVNKNNQKEGRFWNNNMWMLEDLEYTNMMVKPVKKLNLDHLVDRLKDMEGAEEYEEIEVIFSPLHTIDYMIVKNILILNFFKATPNYENEEATIEGKELSEFIEDRIVEMLENK
jgi:hypothetical protein